MEKSTSKSSSNVPRCNDCVNEGHALALAFCEQCKTYLCSSAISSHQQARDLRSHQLKTLVDSFVVDPVLSSNTSFQHKQQQRKTEKTSCSEHNLDLTLFCKEKSCQTALCIHCVSSHKYFFLFFLFCVY